MRSFWTGLPKPFFALAPLDDVTDAAFRRLIAKYGKAPRTDGGRGGPDVMFTEFTSADGLVLAPEAGKQKLLKKLIFSEEERPIVAQLFTSVPEHMEEAARLCARLGFDGVDINMGCPDKAVEKGGCGAALIKNPSLARELIRAAKRGWGAKYGHSMSIFPVSVKTRVGYNKDELESWLPELLAEEPAAIIIHARTRKEMSDVPARWESVARAVEIRNKWQGKTLPFFKTLIIGNGDVQSLAEARARAKETTCDGVMLGRAIFGNPWLFMDVAHPYIPTPEERCRALIEHLALFDELLSVTTSYATMKKHFKSYISGWNGAKELRVRLMETESIAQAQQILSEVVGNTK